jgi:hypothetical protein
VPGRGRRGSGEVSVADAVWRELRALGAEDSALGAGAVVLAQRLDDPATSSSALPAYQRELRETLAVLHLAADESGADRMTAFEEAVAS